LFFYHQDLGCPFGFQSLLLSKTVILAQLSNKVFCRIVAFQPFNHFLRFLLRAAVFCILPFEILPQMAETPNIRWDREGHAHTNALHWEGFPRLLWESLQIFGYDTPPRYDGYEFIEA
jgi:hypothetical protein